MHHFILCDLLSMVTASVFCALWSHNSLQASAKAWDQRQTWKKFVLFVGFWGRNNISASEVILRQTASTTWAHKSEKRGFGLPDRCVLYNAWKNVLPWERFWPLLLNKRRDGRCSQTKKKLQCFVCLELPHFWQFTPETLVSGICNEHSSRLRVSQMPLNSGVFYL